jgi:hypothetical protein
MAVNKSVNVALESAKQPIISNLATENIFSLLDINYFYVSLLLILRLNLVKNQQNIFWNVK